MIIVARKYPRMQASVAYVDGKTGTRGKQRVGMAAMPQQIEVRLTPQAMQVCQTPKDARLADPISIRLHPHSNIYNRERSRPRDTHLLRLWPLPLSRRLRLCLLKHDPALSHIPMLSPRGRYVLEALHQMGGDQ